MSESKIIGKNRQTLNCFIFGLAILGGLSGLKAWDGTQTPLIEYCFQPRQSEEFCNPYQRYVMPRQEFESGKFSPSNPNLQKQRNVFLSDYATKIREIPPSNPYKPLWALCSSGFLAIAWIMNRDATKTLIEVLPKYRSNIQKDWALAVLDNRYQLQAQSQVYEVELIRQKQLLSLEENKLPRVPAALTQGEVN